MAEQAGCRPDVKARQAIAKALRSVEFFSKVKCKDKPSQEVTDPSPRPSFDLPNIQVDDSVRDTIDDVEDSLSELRAGILAAKSLTGPTGKQHSPLTGLKPSLISPALSSCISEELVPRTQSETAARDEWHRQRRLLQQQQQQHATDVQVHRQARLHRSGQLPCIDAPLQSPSAASAAPPSNPALSSQARLKGILANQRPGFCSSPLPASLAPPFFPLQEPSMADALLPPVEPCPPPALSTSLGDVGAYSSGHVASRVDAPHMPRRFSHLQLRTEGLSNSNSPPPSSERLHHIGSPFAPAGLLSHLSPHASPNNSTTLCTVPPPPSQQHQPLPSRNSGPTFQPAMPALNPSAPHQQVLNTSDNLGPALPALRTAVAWQPGQRRSAEYIRQEAEQQRRSAEHIRQVAEQQRPAPCPPTAAAAAAAAGPPPGGPASVADANPAVAPQSAAVKGRFMMATQASIHRAEPRASQATLAPAPSERRSQSGHRSSQSGHRRRQSGHRRSQSGHRRSQSGHRRSQSGHRLSRNSSGVKGRLRRTSSGISLSGGRKGSSRRRVARGNSSRALQRQGSRSASPRSLRRSPSSASSKQGCSCRGGSGTDSDSDSEDGSASDRSSMAGSGAYVPCPEAALPGEGGTLPPSGNSSAAGLTLDAPPLRRTVVHSLSTGTSSFPGDASTAAATALSREGEQGAEGEGKGGCLGELPLGQTPHDRQLSKVAPSKHAPIKTASTSAIKHTRFNLPLVPSGRPAPQTAAAPEPLPIRVPPRTASQQRLSKSSPTTAASSPTAAAAPLSPWDAAPAAHSPTAGPRAKAARAGGLVDVPSSYGKLAKQTGTLRHYLEGQRYDVTRMEADTYLHKLEVENKGRNGMGRFAGIKKAARSKSSGQALPAELPRSYLRECLATAPNAAHGDGSGGGSSQGHSAAGGESGVDMQEGEGGSEAGTPAHRSAGSLASMLAQFDEQEAELKELHERMRAAAVRALQEPGKVGGAELRSQWRGL